MKAFRPIALLLCICACVALACAARHEPAPCDPGTLTKITARCIAEMPKCPKDLAEPCPEYDRCMAELDERQRTCLER